MKKNAQQKISCLRCGRVLPPDEARCSVCLKKQVKEEAAREQRNLTNDIASQPKEESNPHDTFFGWISVFFVICLLLVMTYGFFREFALNGFLSAAGRQGGILWVAGAVVLLWLLGSRRKLEDLGIGFIHKILKYTLISIVTVLFLMIFGSIVGGSSGGLPDNIRF